jgi:integrase
MGDKVSACLYIGKAVLEAAHRIGLNVSKVAENGLMGAIARLNGHEQETVVRNAPEDIVEGRGRDLNPGARLHRQGGQGDEKLLLDFYDFCRVDLRLSDNTAKDYRRFLATLNKPVEETTAEDVRGWLKPLTDGSANTYGNALKPLKGFFRNFMRMPEVVGSFKFKKAPLEPVIVPSKEELQKFYSTLRTPIARALFLMYASSGMRKTELLSLSRDDVDWEKRMIVPKNHTGETKRSWVAFFNAEAEEALKEYLATRKDSSPKLFRVSLHTFLGIWKYACQDSGVRVTPQVLREWFCDEMGRKGVPDRYIDAFCGRVPNSVLAKRYSDFASQKLKEIYENAQLKILN